MVQFLDEHNGKPVTIVSIGCGFEPSFFRLQGRKNHRRDNLVHVDIDFERLLLRKIGFVTNSALKELFEKSLHLNALNCVKDGTSSYVPLACDLEKNEFEPKLRAVLPSEHQLSPILFISEVALVYVEAHACEEVLKAAATFPQAELLMLEQYLPNFPLQSPYADQMLQHFDKLSSLKGTKAHPTLASKRHLLERSGWSVCAMETLLQFFHNLRNSDRFSDLAERAYRTEPFDEW